MRASERRKVALLPIAFGVGFAWGQMAILLAAGFLAGGDPLPVLAVGMVPATALVAALLAAAVLVAPLLVAIGSTIAAGSDSIPVRAGAHPSSLGTDDSRRVSQSVRDAVATIDLSAPEPAAA